MKQKHFLTVMAVLDEKTQYLMNNLQQRIIALGDPGTQTMGIPFHISLGSFPLEKETEVLQVMREIAGKATAFLIEFTCMNTFSDRVLFLQPTENAGLRMLHQSFDCAYADGFPWVPHATLFCGEEDKVRRAKEAIKDTAFPILAQVTALELGRFFPAQFIARYDLQPEDSREADRT